MDHVEVKICGLMQPAQAAACAAAGADAIGIVFYPPSPRCVTPAAAAAIVAAVPPETATVGVFAHADVDTILKTAHEAGLRAVQVHTPLPVLAVDLLRHAGLHVICTLAASGRGLLVAASALPADTGVLVEAGHGILPGGNGVSWDWSGAAVLAGIRSFAIAGGVTPETADQALAASAASALDVSSGVEDKPGVKNLGAVAALIAAARRRAARPGDAPVFSRNAQKVKP